MTSGAVGLYVRDFAVSLAGLCDVIATGSVTLFALDVLKASSGKPFGIVVAPRAGSMTSQATCHELVRSRWERVRCMSVRPASPLHVAGKMTLAAGGAGYILSH